MFIFRFDISIQNISKFKPIINPVLREVQRTPTKNCPKKNDNYFNIIKQQKNLNRQYIKPN